ncbi:hypothetical protein [Bdellovibrio sp. HCB2-146]|uniref:hypothetical protein n=1 Tax=Bdellovibrio sp. HCB2-146 TaxID=3394362 RepID=UPI0039BC5DD4
MLKTLLCAAITIFAFEVSWAGGNCLDTDRVQNEVFSIFTVKSEDSNLKFDACDSKNILRKFAQAILFIKDTPAEKIPAELDLELQDSNPYSYFAARIKTVVFDSVGESRCGTTTMAYVLSDEENTLHVCPYLNIFDMLTMASTLIHESRHIEGYPHSRCQHGTMAIGGGFACDKDYHDYRGSYAVGTLFEARLAISPSSNPVVKLQARSRAVVSLLERFNKLPLDMKTGALLQAADGDVYFYDGEQSQVIMQVPADSILTTRTSLPTFFDSASAQVKSFVYGLGFVETAGEYAQSFRSNYSAQDRTELVDVSYSGDYSCLLFKTKIICGADADPDKELSLGDIQPRQFLSTSNSVMVQKDILYIATAEGDLYPLPMYWKDFQKMKNSDLKKSLTVQNLVSLGPLPGQGEIAVTLTGKALILSNRSWMAPLGLPQVPFRKVFAPYYWSKKLETF